MKKINKKISNLFEPKRNDGQLKFIEKFDLFQKNK